MVLFPIAGRNGIIVDLGMAGSSNTIRNARNSAYPCLDSVRIIQIVPKLPPKNKESHLLHF